MKDISITKGQNLIETFSYNNWNMLDNHTISNANADVYDMSYNYSRGWHLVEKADGIKNTSDKYSYDSYYRLKEVKYDFANNTAIRTDSFFQDGVHNIEQSTENGTTFAWGVDKLNRLRDKKVGNNTEVAYGYDERNNMISEDRSGTTNDKTYIYDDLNRLIEVKDGSQNTIAEYTYDAFNRRITKTVGTTTERYSYDDWNIVEISTNSNNYTNIIDSGTDRHIAIEVTANNTSTLYYFLTDERGNVTALTDENGNILERYRYRVYGDFEILDAQFTPKNCNNQTCYATNLHNFLWGGSLYEPETNLYWMRNRYYHIDMHRFINQDPIGIWGDANNLGNGFAYVAGMVIEASDPTGLISQENSYDIILNTDEEFYQVRKMTEEERMQSLGWMVSALINVWGGWFTSMQLGAILGTISLGGEIATDTGRLDPNLNFALTLTTWKIGLYSLAWQKTKLVKEAVVFSTTKDIYYVVQGFAGIFNRTQNSLKEHKSTSIAENMLNVSNPTESNNKQKDIESPKEKTESPKEEVESKKETTNSNQTSPENNKDGSKETDTNPYDDCDMILEYCVGCPSSNYPSDPDKDPSNAIQKILMSNILSKMLKRGESEQPPFFTDTSTGPNGAIMIYRNPYHINKDPLKTILFYGDNGSGKPMIYRNPFVPGAEYWYNSTTYEKWQQSGFPQTNVDPYFY